MPKRNGIISAVLGAAVVAGIAPAAAQAHHVDASPPPRIASWSQRPDDHRYGELRGLHVGDGPSAAC